MTEAERGACQGVGAALGFSMAWLAQTPVFQVAQEACRGRAGEALGGHLVEASSAPLGISLPAGFTVPTPVRPGGQRQEKEPTRSTQVEPGAQVAAAQSSRFSSQSALPQPLTHTQWKPPAEFWQVPPFLQRMGACVSHSSTSFEQSQPVGVKGWAGDQGQIRELVKSWGWPSVPLVT